MWKHCKYTYFRMGSTLFFTYSFQQHWTELVYLPEIRKEQKHQSELWCRKCLRSKSTKRLRNALQPKPRTTPLGRIKTHLKSYDKRMEAPSLTTSMIINRPANGVNQGTLNDLRKDLKVLDSAAKWVLAAILFSQSLVTSFEYISENSILPLAN